MKETSKLRWLPRHLRWLSVHFLVCLLLLIRQWREDALRNIRHFQLGKMVLVVLILVSFVPLVAFENMVLLQAHLHLDLLLILLSLVLDVFKGLVDIFILKVSVSGRVRSSSYCIFEFPLALQSRREPTLPIWYTEPYRFWAKDMRVHLTRRESFWSAKNKVQLWINFRDLTFLYSLGRCWYNSIFVDKDGISYWGYLSRSRHYWDTALIAWVFHKFSFYH